MEKYFYATIRTLAYKMTIVFNTSIDYLIGLSDIDTPKTVVVSIEKEPELFDIISSYKYLNSSQKTPTCLRK